VLPYLHVPTLGPITIFGLLAFLGVTFAERAGYWHARRLDLDKAQVRRMAAYCAIGGILGAHYFDLFLYQPGWSARPDALRAFFNPFAGISSFGGLIGGTLGFLAFGWRRRGMRLRYACCCASRASRAGSWRSWRSATRCRASFWISCAARRPIRATAA
jgi:prolipoprotein diacylglyceryltransferase